MTRKFVSGCVYLIVLLFGTSLKVEAQTWSFTGNMHVARTYHTATLLGNGQVLVAGGRGIGVPNFASAELYDPAAGTFAYTGNLNTPREYAAAVLLPSGEVLVVGGQEKVGVYNTCLASAELYNPSTGTFTNTGSLNTARCIPTATLLNTGKVLITEGPEAELYDPSSGTFSYTGSPNVSRAAHTVTLLGNGEVLLAGGQDPSGNYLSSAEVYNPATGIFTVTRSMHTSRVFASATLLSDGQVLVAGGWTYVPPAYPILSEAELYDPSTGKFTVTGSMNHPRAYQQSLLLPSGDVLETSGSFTTTTELYDPSKGTFRITGSMTDRRDQGSGANLLNNGEVLVTGGDQNNGGKPFFWITAELYH